MVYIEDSIHNKSKIRKGIIATITLREPQSDPWTGPFTSKMTRYKTPNHRPISQAFIPKESYESIQLLSMTVYRKIIHKSLTLNYTTQ